jgi:hypothetical protein
VAGGSPAASGGAAFIVRVLSTTAKKKIDPVAFAPAFSRFGSRAV